jgi:hypothetical protein
MRPAVLIPLLLAVTSAPSLAQTCDYPRLVFGPSKAAAYLRYEASYRTLSFSIANSSNQPTLTFSDPPLTITANGRNCVIDGGNWRADGFFIARDGKSVFAFEFSGSDASFALYDTATCAKKASVDVSGKNFPFYPENYPIFPRDRARADAKPILFTLGGKNIRLDKTCLAK